MWWIILPAMFSYLVMVKPGYPTPTPPPERIGPYSSHVNCQGALDHRNRNEFDTRYWWAYCEKDQ